jgi:hypothetical protein
MAITTYNEYKRRLKALDDQQQGEFNGANVRRDGCFANAQAKYDAAIPNDAPANSVPVLKAQTELASDRADCIATNVAEEAAIRASYHPLFEQLEKEAREGLARLSALIITLDKLLPLAIAQQQAGWPGGNAPIVTFSTFKGLRDELERDRFMNLLLLLVRVENGSLVFNGVRRTVSDIVAEWSPVQLHVDDVVYLQGVLIGTPPNDTDALRDMLGAGVLHTSWNQAQPSPAEIQRVGLMSDDYSGALDWNRHVIGLSDIAKRVNIQIDATGVDLDFIFVEVQSSSPKTRGQESSALQLNSIAPAEKYAVPRTQGNASGSSTYQLSLDINSIDKVRAPGHTVATMVRNGGTSDEYFRRQLGYASRGSATIPTGPGESTGDEQAEIPDALRVLEASGVEVLRVTLVDLPADVSVVESECHRLIWSPAEIVYVSCHGKKDQSCLSGDGETCWTGSNSLDRWHEVTQSSAIGTVPGSPHVLIIAGCSLMELSPGSLYWGPVQGPGVSWVRLMFERNASLAVMLGYGYTRDWHPHWKWPPSWSWLNPVPTISAPRDDPVGNSIAAQMADIIASSPDVTDLAPRWLQLNMAHRAWMAVAVDQSGYWLIGRAWNFKHEVFGPIGLDPRAWRARNHRMRFGRWRPLRSRFPLGPWTALRTSVDWKRWRRFRQRRRRDNAADP